MKKNLWNKLFHSKELKKEESMAFIRPLLISDIKNSKSLKDVFELHKKAWERGFRNENIGPCPYGMFRTSDILTMTPEQVYLGGIYGLFTLPLPKWEENKDEVYGVNGFRVDPKTTIYDIVLTQYKNHLISNL